MAARVLGILAACGLLVGCAAHDGNTTAGSRNSDPTAYLVCPSLASVCTSTTFFDEPSQLNLYTADSHFVQGVFVAHITWRGWGTATATGLGVATTDNCKPNCEEGTTSPHQATIVATDPKPWRGKMIYTRVLANVPAVSYHEVYNAGLMPQAQNTAPDVL